MSYTLVIPTHNRPTYLKRSFEYLSRLGYGNRIVIADSSEGNIARSNSDLVDKFIGVLNIDYLHMEGVDNYTLKVVNAIERVRTETMMFCGDDDFIVPEQVNRCSDFLIKNKEYSIASGKILQFRRSKIFRSRHFLWTEYRQRRISSNESSARVQNLLSDYRPTWYAVHRTKNFLKNFERSFEKDIGRSLVERLFCVCDSIDGKSKLFDNLFLIREADNTLTDEYGNKTWNDLIEKAEIISRENQKYFLYESMVIESLGSKELNSDVYSIISNDFERWMQRKNELRQGQLTRLQYFTPNLYLLLSRLKSKFFSDRYIKTLNDNERDYLREIVQMVSAI